MTTTKLAKSIVGLLLVGLVTSPLGVGHAGEGEPHAGAQCPTYSGNSADMEPLPPAFLQYGGALTGQFAVSATGAASYTVPLVAPPGRLGIEPQLSVGYSSGGSVGPLGLGFNLSGFSAIERCPSNRADDGYIRAVKLDALDKLCLDGKRLVPIGEHQEGGVTVREYRTLPDSLVKVLGYMVFAPTAGESTDQPSRFTVLAPSGTVSQYGDNDNSRFIIPDGARRPVLRWMLSSVADRRQNRMNYTYEHDIDVNDGHSLDARPSRIEYGANHFTGTPHSRAVVFHYDFQNPAFKPERQYAFGVTHGVAGSKLLSQIEMLAEGFPVRTYDFAYTHEAYRHQFLLENMQECAPVSGCKPKLQFGWTPTLTTQPEVRAIVLTPEHVLGKIYTETDEAYLNTASRTVVDVTGDGLPDIVIASTTAAKGGKKEIVWRVARNRGGFMFDAFEEWARLPSFEGENDVHATPIDYDDDGLVDLLIDVPVIDVGASQLFVLRSNPSGGFTLTYTNIPRLAKDAAEEFRNSAHSSWMTADLDTDGKLDLIECIDHRTTDGHPDYVKEDCFPNSPCAPSLARWSVRLWTKDGSPQGGKGFSANPIPLHALDGITCTALGQRVIPIDLDADGQAEILAQGEDFSTDPPGLMWSTHRLDPATHTWQTQPIPDLPPGLGTNDTVALLHFRLTHPYVGSIGEKGLLFPDLNGDGLSDVLFLPYWGGGNPSIDEIKPQLAFLNTGKDAHFVPTPAAYPDVFGFPGEDAWVLDYNGDGRDDVLVRGYEDWRFHLTNGAGQAPTPSMTAPAFQVADVDGDGRADFIHLTGDLNKRREIHIYKHPIKPLFVNTITTGLNPLDPADPGFLPDVQITYDTMVDRALGWALDPNAPEVAEAPYRARYDAENTCEYPRACSLSFSSIVSEYRLNNGKSQPRRFTLQYRDGRQDRAGRGFLGFGSRLLRDRDSGATTVEWFDNQTYDADFRTYPFAGIPFQTWSFVRANAGDPDPTRVDMQHSKGTSTVLPTNAGKTYLVRGVSSRSATQVGSISKTDFDAVYDYVTDPAHDAFTTYERHNLNEDFDAFGFAHRTTSWSENIVQFDVTTTVLSHDVNHWLIGRVEEQKTCSTSPTDMQCNVVENDYNAFGELEETRRAPLMPSAFLKTRFIRDAFGNVIRTTADDAFGQHRESCRTYEPDGIFPWAQANAAGHVSYSRFDHKLGVLLSARDPNGLVTKHRYDKFGIRTETKAPDGNVTKNSVAHVKLGEWRTLVTTELPGGAKAETTLDSLGRTLRRRAQGPNVPTVGSQGYSTNTPWFVKDWSYDFFGRASDETIAYLEGDPLAGTYHWHKTYDAAGRVVATTSPTQTTVTHSYEVEPVPPPGPFFDYAYGINVVKTITPGTSDYAGPVVTTTYSDLLGRVAKIVDAKGGATQYHYGPFGRLHDVVAVDNHVTILDQDAYGRLVHRLDMDRGEGWMAYDGFDQLRSTTDALGRQTAMAYDTLGRVKNRLNADGLTTYQYDTALHGIGALASVTMPGTPGSSLNHVRTMTYDQLSRPETVTFNYDDGVQLQSQLVYDAFSRVQELRYPAEPGASPFSVIYEYAVDGRIKQVDGGFPREQLWSLEMVDGNTGRTAQERLGANITTDRGYDPQRGTLEYIFTTGAGGTILQNVGYQYDVRGNLEARRDYLQPDERDALPAHRPARLARGDHQRGWRGAGAPQP